MGFVHGGCKLTLLAIGAIWGLFGDNKETAIQDLGLRKLSICG